MKWEFYNIHCHRILVSALFADTHPYLPFLFQRNIFYFHLFIMSSHLVPKKFSTVSDGWGGGGGGGGVKQVLPPPLSQNINKQANPTKHKSCYPILQLQLFLRPPLTRQATLQNTPSSWIQGIGGGGGGGGKDNPGKCSPTFSPKIKNEQVNPCKYKNSQKNSTAAALSTTNTNQTANISCVAS